MRFSIGQVEGLEAMWKDVCARELILGAEAVDMALSAEVLPVVFADTGVGIKMRRRHFSGNCADLASAGAEKGVF